MSIVALIPARSGSKRIAGKNIRRLGDHPLLAYTIAAARDSGVFDDVVVSSDDHRILTLAMLDYGASIIQRPAALAQDDSADIGWVRHALDALTSYPCFAILRPTSPFRTADTIRRAYRRFSDVGGDCHSLRAVERARQHPNKMWTVSEGSTSPTLWLRPFTDSLVGEWVEGQDWPWSRPSQSLPHVYAQNASLEIAWSSNVYQHASISGTRIVPFFTEGREGLDLNTEDDFLFAQMLVERGLVTLPEVNVRNLLEVYT